ncbi:uncharacterized protein LOC111408696 [Olea europaea var. sylvestris]|uniref:Uncharacterized protein n=1 Tax=Olea europaea subsp. europaea TaxID=158383 RepID=A0A8S0RMV1_OLEEU|nr:uncharacterized protein LOC111408696 [Olea europaea var. sylvestris]CAA2981248.1 Hypothetical predicted protein [Olea europaea subsp. europaea]
MSKCFFHPDELVVGVCALCLNQKLLVLASKQGHIQQKIATHKQKKSVALPKIFALNGQEIRRHKSKEYCLSSSSSGEDSFISIKFEDNGVASWDKGTTKKIKSVVEQAKPQRTLMWRRRIGYLFQLSRWRKSSKHNVGTKLEGAKVRYGWIRTLAKRETKE